MSSFKASAIAALGIALSLSACASKKSSGADAGFDGGGMASGGKGGHGGQGGAGGKGGSNSTGTGDGGMMMTMPTLMCTEPAPTAPVVCGGQTCMAPAAFAMNPCVVPCCVNVNGQEMCASKSTAMGFSTECSLPATPDSSCPDVTSMGMMGANTFKGCCNVAMHKCGIISTLRPGCITTSTLLMLPADPKTCGGGGGDDGGTEQDAGH